MSIFDEFSESGDENSDDDSSKKKSTLDEFSDKDDDEAKAEKQTEEDTKEAMGQTLLAAIKGNNPKELYEAITDLISNMK